MRSTVCAIYFRVISFPFSWRLSRTSSSCVYFSPHVTSTFAKVLYISLQARRNVLVTSPYVRLILRNYYHSIVPFHYFHVLCRVQTLVPRSSHFVALLCFILLYTYTTFILILIMPYILVRFLSALALFMTCLYVLRLLHGLIPVSPRVLRFIYCFHKQCVFRTLSFMCTSVPKVAIQEG